jgi:hypothetical protein
MTREQLVDAATCSPTQKCKECKFYDKTRLGAYNCIAKAANEALAQMDRAERWKGIAGMLYELANLILSSNDIWGWDDEFKLYQETVEQEAQG